jgi:hypothetical protein
VEAFALVVGAVVLDAYVGWDFAIAKEGGGVELLEGNIPPGEDITQLNSERGLWYEMLNWK